MEKRERKGRDACVCVCVCVCTGGGSAILGKNWVAMVSVRALLWQPPAYTPLITSLINSVYLNDYRSRMQIYAPTRGDVRAALTQPLHIQAIVENPHNLRRCQIGVNSCFQSFYINLSIERGRWRKHLFQNTGDSFICFNGTWRIDGELWRCNWAVGCAPRQSSRDGRNDRILYRGKS